MCGITALWSDTQSDLQSAIKRMTDAITHRGPDDSGSWIDPDTGLALGHRRLSILDLSPLGHQPMASNSGRFWMVFNGEIYNYQTLKTELINSGHSFRGGSDTEVMLAAFEQWGVHESLQRFVGMFAFAVWDKRELSLSIARDRAGEKPLYFGWNKEHFLLASELKAIRACPETSLEIDRGALCCFMRYNYIPAPWSIYQGIYKLLPGSVLTLRREELTHRPAAFSPWPEETERSLRPTYYWRPPAPTASAGVLSITDASAQLEALLLDVVAGQMVADVPLGAFLSGGVDSSLVVALMQKQSSRPVRTFSIGFHEPTFNEAHHAKRVAHHLGTDHTELYVTPEETRAVIPLLPAFFDEPFADSSQVPTYLVSKLARSQVTVSLSGDGGDELFGGYSRFVWADKIWRKLSLIPPVLRTPVAFGLTLFSQDQIDWMYQHSRVLPKIMSFRAPGKKIHRLAAVIKNHSFGGLYRELLSHWDPPDRLVLGGAEPKTPLSMLSEMHIRHPQEWMMYADLLSYLPDDILVKVDRASMAVSLESRAPLLDYRVMEFARSLPTTCKISGTRTKLVMRELLRRYVPDELVERPKMGFGIPVGGWLRGPLRDWAEDLLNRNRLRQEGFLDPELVHERWDDHLRGERDWTYELWDVLMWQAWLRGAQGC